MYNSVILILSIFSEKYSVINRVELKIYGVIAFYFFCTSIFSTTLWIDPTQFLYSLFKVSIIILTILWLPSVGFLSHCGHNL